MRGRRRKPVSGALIRLLLALTIISSLLTSSYSIRLPTKKLTSSLVSGSFKKLMGFRNRGSHQPTNNNPPAAAVTSNRKKSFKWIRNRLDVLPVPVNNSKTEEQHNKKTKSKRIFRIPLPFPLIPNKKKKNTPKQEVVHLPEAYLNAVEIIKYRGYPAQIYHVTTDDGYILEVHRIPHGKGQSVDAGATGSPVFLQHGFMDSDAGWLLSSSERSLAFRLADSGYDVWLGNARGNTYSTRHTTLDTSQQPYWNFSYDEMGKYDIPAVINYVLSVTGRSTMSYVGHSMGCAMFFIAMTYHPELNAKISVMMALGPATNLSHMRSPVAYLTPFYRPIELTLELFQVRQFLRNDALIPRLQRRFCDINVQSAGLCRNVLLASVGDDSNQMPSEVLPLIDHHFPAGTSLHTTSMLAQNHNSGDDFIPYDFGIIGNLRKYGQRSPPPYDLRKVTCKVYLFYGPNDLLVVPEDVAWLASELPNVQATIRVNYHLYNHFDFLYATDNNQLVYDQLISYLPSST